MLPANDNLLIKLCSVCLIVTILFTLQNASFAWDTNLNPQLHIVIIMDTPDGINPLSLSIKKGDTVGWYNQGLEPVTIKFTAPLGIVCSPLINFYADIAGYYRTGRIFHGGTASLCFVRDGEFEYEVRRIVKESNKEPHEKIIYGKVIVKE
jgi:hypothetical protein